MNGNGFLLIDRLTKIHSKEKKHIEYMRKHKKNITISGIRKAEGGQRTNAQCFSRHGGIIRFNPLVPIKNDWIDWYIKRNKIAISTIYLPPYNFVRTGCIGCPFSRTLEKELQILKQYFPTENILAEKLWQPVYNEYRKKNYRLKAENYLTLF